LEDYDDLMPIWTRQSEALKETYGEYFLADLLECQDEENQAVVCEDGDTAVGFMSLSSQVNVSLLQECFHLGLFHGLCKAHPDDILRMPEKPSWQGGEDKTNQRSQEVESLSPQNFEHTHGEGAAVQKDGAIATFHTALLIDDVSDVEAAATPLLETEEEGAFHPVYRGTSNAFCVRLLCIDEKHETRSLDFLPYVFQLFPDKDFCVILVPHHVPEFHLIQSFVRVVPFFTSKLGRELYVFHRAGLLMSFNVRKATTDDLHDVRMLIKTLHLSGSILNDLQTFTLARRDPDIEYIRSHYNIEDFIHFNHHQQEEHGHLHHFVLNPIFRHYSKHFLKEILRLAHKSSLYYPIYPQGVGGKNPCAHSLTSALHYMVPVRPRRQIFYPLEELGMNAPSEQVSKDQ
ncbi:PREDICTED: uncharacterized protein C20orf26 homolog, partial [Eurypyga helias]|uniref:uncharacterized protein C20orf26 homolog n=1 Tax=Eurypyga helias TaxID=54383 RepID=UPI00052844D1